MVSAGDFWPSQQELSRYLKYMARTRIPEFESDMPSHAVRSPWASGPATNTGPLHTLGRKKAPRGSGARGHCPYTTGTQDGRSVNTYTDRYGNTTGWVGGKYQNTYSDGYGGTTGTLGNKRINTYDDGYGNTTGTIGRDRIDLHTDRSGVTTGTVGQRRLNCYSNRFSTTCY
jgi:hypothetical protein